MQTDIPLKRLTALRAADLLPLLGAAGAEVLGIETLELPASATRLDNVLHLRSPHGQEYWHILEWQGYPDPGVLWRTTGYIAWFGQRDPARTIIATVIYLVPTADAGETLQQSIDGQVVLDWHLPVIRLWEIDAAAALQQGSVGLAVLSPLMRGADAASVEHAIVRVREHAPLAQHADLFSILGVFAEPLIAPERLEHLIGKEKLMTSSFLTYMMREKLAELEQQHAAEREKYAVEFAAKTSELEQQHMAELAAKEQQHEQYAAELAAKVLHHALHEAAEDAVVLRFPNTPAILVHHLRHITEPAQLKALRTRLLQATDQAAVERVLTELAPRDDG